MPFNDEFGMREVEYQTHFGQFAVPFLTGKNARVMVHQAGSEATKIAGPMAIGVFKTAVAADPALKTTAEVLASFRIGKRR